MGVVGTYCWACRPYFSADFHQTKTILKRLTSTLRWEEWKVAHGPTTWPPLWLSEAVFITDRAKLEFLVSTYCRACRPYFLADFNQTWWVPDHLEAGDLYFTMGRMKSSSRANNMASVVVKRGRLHYGPGKVGILGEYLLSSLSALFLGRFSSNTDHFEAGNFTMGEWKVPHCRACRPYFLADFHQTKTILKRVTSTLRWVEWKVAHGPTTWPPLWLSEAVFITDRAYNAGAKLEFGPYASNYLITGLACLAIYCFMYM